MYNLSRSVASELQIVSAIQYFSRIYLECEYATSCLPHNPLFVLPNISFLIHPRILEKFNFWYSLFSLIYVLSSVAAAHWPISGGRRWWYTSERWGWWRGGQMRHPYSRQASGWWWLLYTCQRWVGLRLCRSSLPLNWIEEGARFWHSNETGLWLKID